jgi:hypothetical protein
MLEAEAAQTAAGTLPPAIDVKVTDDWIVEGRMHRKTKPA